METSHLSNISFAELGLDPRLLRALDDQGFSHCTPIQAKALPLLLKGENVAGQAQTGTGKTIAFLLGVMNDMLTLPEIDGRHANEPRALMMAPTRELAIQIYNDAVMLAKYTDFNVRVVYGGAGYEKQRQDLIDGVDILIGTTGRLIDYFKQKAYGLDGIDCVVLDEADRMFDLGFIDDIRYLFRRMPKPDDRLNMLFSATLSHRVNELAYEHMNNPTHVKVEAEQVTADKVRESLFYPANNEKAPLLISILRDLEPPRAMVFANTKRECEKIWGYLVTNGFEAGLLTGDVPQKKRISLLDELRSEKISVLVATDVAARGLHIEGVSHVFNYDLPDEAEDYVHRIGRTARAGATGDAISFACEDNAFNLPAIEEYIEHNLPVQEVPHESLPELNPPKRLARAPGRGRPSGSRSGPGGRGGPRRGGAGSGRGRR